VVDLTEGGKTWQTTVNLPGGYNIYNACGTAAVGRALGFDMDLIVGALGHFAGGFRPDGKIHHRGHRLSA